MMADAPCSENVQARTFFVFQNERYSPISGWSAKGLLPTDRSPFTTPDGADGFTNLLEATSAFISLGWEWLEEQDWKVDMNLDNIDADGWTYSVDFGSLKDENCGSKLKGAMHFVRRRRMVRYQVFNVRLIAPEAQFTCSYCDLEELGRLAGLLLEKLAKASAYKHPTKSSDAKSIALKNHMLTILNLGSAVPETYSFALVESRLNTFVLQSKSGWSTASSMLGNETHEEIARKRSAALSHTLFTPDETFELARLIIRVLDHAHHFHCANPHCGRECEFSIETCPNEGCGMTYSRKWMDDHSEVCPHKILPCERKCGENVKRLMMREHLDQFCMLRIVRCPCYDLGCKLGILARDLDQHAADSQVTHLALIVARLKEVQHVVAGHQSDIADLGKTCTDTQTALAGVTAGLATAMAAIKGAEARSDRNIKDSVRALENRVAKDEAATSALRSDISTIRTQISKK